MRVRLAAIGAFGDAHRLDAIGHDDARDIVEVLEELLEPELEIQAVPQDQLGIMRLQDVARRRLIVVDLGAGLGDRFDDGGVAGDVCGHVGDHREGGDGLEFLLRPCGTRSDRENCQCRCCRQDRASRLIDHSILPDVVADRTR